MSPRRYDYGEVGYKDVKFTAATDKAWGSIITKMKFSGASDHNLRLCSKLMRTCRDAVVEHAAAGHPEGGAPHASQFDLVAPPAHTPHHSALPGHDVRKAQDGIHDHAPEVCQERSGVLDRRHDREREASCCPFVPRLLPHAKASRPCVCVVVGTRLVHVSAQNVLMCGQLTRSLV